MNDKQLKSNIVNGLMPFRVVKYFSQDQGKFRNWLRTIFNPAIDRQGFLSKKFITYRESICVLIAYRELCELKLEQTCADEFLILKHDTQNYNVRLKFYLRENNLTLDDLYPLEDRVQLIRNALNFAFREKSLKYINGIVNICSEILTNYELYCKECGSAYRNPNDNFNALNNYEQLERTAAELWYLSYSGREVSSSDSDIAARLCYDIVTAKICSTEIRQLCKGKGSFQSWLRELFVFGIEDHGFLGQEIITYRQMVNVLIAYHDICIAHHPPMTADEFCDIMWAAKYSECLSVILEKRAVTINELLTIDIRMSFIQNIISYWLRSDHTHTFSNGVIIEPSLAMYPEEFDFIALKPRPMFGRYRNWDVLTSLSARIWEKQYPSGYTAD